jgi:hypothetical protein
LKTVIVQAKPTELPDAPQSVLDFPRPGPVAGGPLKVAGWFKLQSGLRTVRVQVCLREFGNKILWEAEVTERHDVRLALALGTDVVAFGYDLLLHKLDLPSAFTLDVWVEYGDARPLTRLVLATIHGTNTAGDAVLEAVLAPLYILGLGRSGTTALMKMLGRHPSIVCGEKYPLEICVSTFHAKMTRIASSFAEHDAFSMARLFSDEQTIGPNPFASLAHVDREVMNEVLESTCTMFGNVASEANDIWYSAIAARDQTKSAKFFVEKTVPNQALVNALNVYPTARCIVLVRDPRDIFLSRIRFNKKRGTRDFGEQVARDTAHWAEMHIDECRSLFRIHESFRNRVIKVIRYEDLMTNTAEILASFCQSLGIQYSAEIINLMVESGRDSSGQFANHRTDSQSDDLSPETVRFLKTIADGLPEFLQAYGYPY